MAQGYDKFFQAARKNAQQGSGIPKEPRSSMQFPFQDSAQKRSNQKKSDWISGIFSEDRVDAAKQQATPSDNQELVQILRGRLQAKRKSNRNPRSRRSQFLLVSTCLVLLGILGFGYKNIEQVDHLVSKLEVGVFGLALANEDKKAAAPATAAAKVETDEKNPAAEKQGTRASKDFKPDEVAHFEKLNDRKRELDAREEELNRMDTELQAQRLELEKRVDELEKKRRQISSLLDDRVKADDQKVETLVQMYSNMKPQQAASVFEKMDEDLAVEILGRMKKKNAAEIMNIMKSEKAQILSEKFAGYSRRKPATSNQEGGNKN